MTPLRLIVATYLTIAALAFYLAYVVPGIP